MIPKTCFICDGTDFQDCFERQGDCYYRCLSCSLLISSVSDRSDEGHQDLAVACRDDTGRKSTFRNQLRRFERHRKLNRLLDVGCGSGGFLTAAKEAGWQVEGTEVSVPRAEATRKRGIQVHLGDLLKLDLETGILDGVRLHNVIEHLKDPLGYLKACHRIIRMNGLILLSTPNLESHTASHLGSKWRYLAPTHHVHIFGKRNLTRLCEKLGFAVLRVRTKGFRYAEEKSRISSVLNGFFGISARASGRGHRMYFECEKVSEAS